METDFSWKLTLAGAKDKGKVRRGFQLEHNAVVVFRQLKDGHWEAWVEENYAPFLTQNSTDSPSFFGPTRFKAQCKAANWFWESKPELAEICA